ncbi:MAG: hypothetical protein WAM94_06335 [Chromatiaceae bacterium]
MPILHIPVAVVVEGAAVVQADRGVGTAAAGVFLHQPARGKFALGVFVEIAQPAMGGRGIQVEVALLNVLAMVALVACESEQTFLEDAIASVP